jgi:hypothetical protein
MNTASDLPSLRAYRPHPGTDLIRVGNAFDGGYVLPRAAVTATQAVLSLGVEADWSFEEAMLAHNPGITLTCVDGTTGPDVIRARVRRDLRRALVRLRGGKVLRMLRLLNRHEEFKVFFARHDFLKLMVAPESGPGLATVDELLARVRGADPQRWVLLKMDIEGAEYEVLPAVADRLQRVTALAIEFHQLDRNWGRFEAIMAALAPTFYVAHIHGNNNDKTVPGTQVPLTIEITLMNRALVGQLPPPATAGYPLAGLDAPNQPRRPDMVLDFR